MYNEIISIKNNRWVNGEYELKQAIKLLRKAWQYRGHIYSDSEKPSIIRKFHWVDGWVKIRFMVVAYPYNIPKTDQDKFAWFLLSEIDHPKSFEWCLNNLAVYENY